MLMWRQCCQSEYCPAPRGPMRAFLRGNYERSSRCRSGKLRVRPSVVTPAKAGVHIPEPAFYGFRLSPGRQLRLIRAATGRALTDEDVLANGHSVGGAGQIERCDGVGVD